MISGRMESWVCAAGAVRSARDGEVAQVGDPVHGVVDAVAFEAAVPQDLPALHACEGVLDTGSYLQAVCGTP